MSISRRAPSHEPETTVLLHSPMAVRAELNLDLAELELWYSPRAGRSLAERDFNFSNRDDHTRVFDRIRVQGVSPGGLMGVDYDPFHVVVSTLAGRIHLLMPPTVPGVVLWSDRPQVIDLKSDKMDASLACDATVFAVRHAERGEVLEFAAAAAGGFRHPPVSLSGRSLHARLELAPGVPVAFVAGVAGEDAAVAGARRLASLSPEELVAEVEAWVRPREAVGAMGVRGRPDLQRLLEVNRRVMLSMQDASGVCRAALRRIYYLVWVRDAGMCFAHDARAGHLPSLEAWVPVLLANPQTVDEPGLPCGRTYGQLLSDRMGKLEEDGPFYAVLAAVTDAVQSGAGELPPGGGAVLADAVDWLERRCFDTTRGLFGRYFYCEAPLAGSRDQGWDLATGEPGTEGPTPYAGRNIRRSYDVYINLIMVSTYRMLALVAAGPERVRRLGQATALETALEGLLEGDLPSYGLLETTEGDLVRADPYGMDKCDYHWGLTVPPLLDPARDWQALRARLLEGVRREADHLFLAEYGSILASLDTERVPECAVVEAIDRLVPLCVRPGRYLPMPYTIFEYTGVPDGHLYHDVRPQAFSISTFLAAVANLGVRWLPQGVAVRAGACLSSLTDYRWRGRRLDFSFEGTGPVAAGVSVGGRPLGGCLQVPEAWVASGERVPIVVRAGEPPAEPVWVDSTLRLLDVSGGGGERRFSVEAFGCNAFSLRRADLARVECRRADGTGVPLRLHVHGPLTAHVFDGEGVFEVVVTVRAGG